MPDTNPRNLIIDTPRPATATELSDHQRRFELHIYRLATQVAHAKYHVLYGPQFMATTPEDLETELRQFISQVPDAGQRAYYEVLVRMIYNETMIFIMSNEFLLRH